MKDKNGYLVADSYSTSDQMKNCFNELPIICGLHVLRIKYVLLCNQSQNQVLMKLKFLSKTGISYISRQQFNPAEMMQAGSRKCLKRLVDLYWVSGIKQNCHNSGGQNLLLYLFIINNRAKILQGLSSDQSYYVVQKEEERWKQNRISRNETSSVS